jgi:hypothetical protein
MTSGWYKTDMNCINESQGVELPKIQKYMRGQLQPMDTAPKDGSYIILAGDSEYNGTPLRYAVCKYDADYRPLQPWVTHSGDSFLDGGRAPLFWMPLPVYPGGGIVG